MGLSTALQDRLTDAVEKRLGVAATFLRWDEHKPTGAQIPVFAVPYDAIPVARAAGLTVEAQGVA